jgi:hypothetical protein
LDRLNSQSAFRAKHLAQARARPPAVTAGTE